MKEEKKSQNKPLKPAQQQNESIDGSEVRLEELESLCSGFARRPRGCGGFTSTDDTDDILF